MVAAFKEFVVYVYPRVLEGLLAVWLILIFRERKDLAGWLREIISKRGAAAAAALFAAALAIRLCVVPRVHRVYFDEFEHLNIAENLSRFGAFAESLAGGTERLDVLAPPLWPGGFHVLFGLLFRVIGFSESAAFRANALVASLTLVLLFLMGASFFRSESAGFLGALFLCLAPDHLEFSGATDLAPMSLLWVLGSFVALAYHLRTEGRGSLLLFLATSLYAANCRAENLFLPILQGGVLLLRRRARFEQDWAVWGFSLVFLVSLAVIAGLDSSRAPLGFDYSPRDYASHFAKQALPNLFSLCEPLSGRFLLTLFAGWGVYEGIKNFREQALLLFVFSVSLFLVYSGYRFGNFYAGEGNRYRLILEAPLALFAGLGLARQAGRLRWKRSAAAATLAAYGALALPAYGRPPDETFDAQYRLIRDSARFLSPRTYVVAYAPSAVLVAARRPAVSPELLIEDKKGFERRAGLESPAESYVLFKDYWWHRRPRSSRRMEQLFAKDYEMKPISVFRSGSLEYGFYALTRRVLPRPR